MKLVIIDGQGGKIGKLLIEKLKASSFQAEFVAIGTNSIATSVMVKAGAEYAATGENPVLVNVRDADIIVGPIGIIVADAMLGEVTPAMAAAIGQSRAEKVLLPINKCKNHVVGVSDSTISELVNEAVQYILSLDRNN